MDYFAKNIKFLRLQKGLKQSEIATPIGFTQAAWSEYELGSSKPRFNDLMRITDYFCITIFEMIELDLQKLNPNDILEFRKMAKKLNPNLNLSLNLNSENCKKNIQDKEANVGVNPAVLDQLNRIEKELRDLRSKLAQ